MTTVPTKAKRVSKKTKAALDTIDVVVEKPKKKPVNYLNNKDLLTEVVLSKEQGKMTDKLAKMLMLLTARYGTKGNVASYTYNEDMQSYALMMLCRTWKSFNVEKSNNPFAFFTQCVKNSFIQYLNAEKKHRDIRDQMLVDNGMSPSLRFQMDNQDSNYHMLEDLPKNNDDYINDYDDND